VAVVFIHGGYSPYLEFSLRQARAADPGADLLLLGDAANDRFPFLRHVDASAPAFRAAAEPVARVYEHWSTNRRAFELACFQRWFLLRALMEREGLDDALVLDSDVMLYASEEEVRRTWLGGKVLGVCWPNHQYRFRWGASPHVSYWTAETVGAFCDFILAGYTDPALRARYLEKWHHHLATGTFGSICDMTALYFFAQQYPAERVAWFTEVQRAPDGPVTCDDNVNLPENAEPDEYRMAGPIKEVTWDAAGRPLGYNVRLGQRVRFHALHFQGKAKEFMPAHYRGQPFRGVGLLRARLFTHYKARRLASKVAQPARLLAGQLRAKRSAD
jgi:hypothetical protein